MKSNIKVRIEEHPGKVGQYKAGELSRLCQRVLSRPGMLAEANKRIAENKKKTETCQSRSQ